MLVSYQNGKKNGARSIGFTRLSLASAFKNQRVFDVFCFEFTGNDYECRVCFSIAKTGPSKTLGFLKANA